MSGWHKLGPFTVFDLETTGMSAVRDRIVEIGAVRVETDGTFSRYETLVNPGVPIPWQVSQVHGITDEMVAAAPKFKDAAYAFLDFAKGSKLVAHNARFDFSFLQESLARTGLPIWKFGIYDSIILIRRAYPGLPSYSLQALRQNFGLGQDIDEARPHRAGYDAEITMEAFSMAMRRLYAM
ncbi:MAG: 3'-5' exonuclease [Lentisphaeria bacterium]|nr:3'-5' exonuclease [Lentisphaeria bacterium]